MNNHTEIPITTNSNNINNPNNPYVHISPAPPSSASNNNNRECPNQTLDSICDGFNRCSRTVEKAARHAENMVDNFWNHIRISSSPADAAMARIVQGTRALTNGGSDKLFQQTFGFVPGERLLKPFACYISTTSGPVIGTLYVSNKRVAFCSDYPICHHPMSFQHHRSSCIYYKVVLELPQVSTVSPSTNRFNPSEKYIQIVSVDGYEFYFMGFISYDMALKTLNEALHQFHNYSGGNGRLQLQ
ncbi:GEM-like protein 2 isoform X3 [Arachis ipaensis]|uniref:GEM-like protein 2 isoform X3 n=1 Tax=Arachis ipaensis TaxID=130454 RepID=UPI000A2B2A6E|nr:GEM-like protein 2 isoform X3 [Arachis ipaensis]